MRIALLILSTLMVYSLCGQNNSVNSIPITDQEQLKWGGTYQYKSNPYDTVYGFYTFYLRTVTYSQNGVELWTIDLPKRMQAYAAQSIYDRTGDSTGRKIPKDEIDINKFYHQEFLKCPVLITDKIIAISDRSGFLILNKQTGSFITDIQYQYEEDFFRCDEGTFVIKKGKTVCKGTIPNGSSFISICGRNLFHFNEQELFVWNDETILLKRIRYKRDLHFKKSKKALHYKAVINHKDFNVEMEGWVFVK